MLFFFPPLSDAQGKNNKNKNNKQEKTADLAHFSFFAFVLQETHEIVAIKKFKDSEGNLFCCLIFHEDNYIVNISPFKIRSLIYQDMI